MEIGYSEETLRNNIICQVEQIGEESEWLAYYFATAPASVECIEDSVKNILDSCKAILENIEHLKGEKM